MPTDIPSSCRQEMQSGPKEIRGFKEFEEALESSRGAELAVLANESKVEVSPEENYKHAGLFFKEICTRGNISEYNFETMRDSNNEKTLEGTYTASSGKSIEVRLHAPKKHRSSLPLLHLKDGDEDEFKEFVEAYVARGIRIVVSSAYGLRDEFLRDRMAA